MNKDISQYTCENLIKTDTIWLIRKDISLGMYKTRTGLQVTKSHLIELTLTFDVQERLSTVSQRKD